MALITRLARLFRADLHAVLDRIEEPDLLLRQAVREMEEDLARDEQQLKKLTGEQSLLAVRQDDTDQSLHDIEEELDLCFSSGNDDLARALVKRKLEAERFRKLLARKRETLDQARAELETRLDEHRGRLDSMRQRAELLAEEESTQPDDRWATPDFSVRDEDVEVAFLREQQKRSRP